MAAVKLTSVVFLCKVGYKLVSLDRERMLGSLSEHFFQSER
jgi:hypothetical protein